MHTLALVALTSALAATAPMDVPDPRPARHVVDLTGTLGPEELAAIDGAAAQASANGELLVVMVQSTDGLEPRQWATILFNRLRLDTKERNRGVLFMAAIGDRKAEIVVGDGFPGDVTRHTDAVMQDVVVAHFKRGDPKGAMTNGARAIADHVIGSSTGGAAAAAPITAYAPPDESADSMPLDSDNPFVWLGGAAGLGVGGLGVREVLRRRPRSCKRCNVRMDRLGEAADDAHLMAGERAEERVGSVDYDIWSCGTCGEVLKTRWGTIFSRYAKCGGCAWRTMRSTSRTITAATTSSSGLAEVTESCEHCGRVHTYTRVIPRVTKSSSSSSSGGGFSSGRGSSGSW